MLANRRGSRYAVSTANEFLVPVNNQQVEFEFGQRQKGAARPLEYPLMELLKDEYFE